MKRILPLFVLCLTALILLAGCKKVKISSNDNTSDNASDNARRRQENQPLVGTWKFTMRGDEQVTNGKTNRDSTVITIKFKDNDEYEVTYLKSNNPLWSLIADNTETFSGTYSFNRQDRNNQVAGTLTLNSRDLVAAIGAKWVTQLLNEQPTITGSTDTESQRTATTNSPASSSILNTLLTTEQHTNTINELKKEVNVEKERALKTLEQLQKNNKAPKPPSSSNPEEDAKKKVEEIVKKVQDNNSASIMDLVYVLVQLKVAPKAGAQQEEQKKAEVEARLSVHTAIKEAIKKALENTTSETYLIEKADKKELILKANDDKYITFDTSKNKRSPNTRLSLIKTP